MTSQDIDWDKLDEMKEKSKVINNDFDKLKKLKEKNEKISKEQQTIENEIDFIENKYKQEYSESLNNKIEGYGILTVISYRTNTEGYIVRVTDDTIKVKFFDGYDYNPTFVEVPIKELKENGYCEKEIDNKKYFIVDKIKDPLKYYNLIEYFLKIEFDNLLHDKDYYQEEIVRYNESLEKVNKELEDYKKVPDNKIRKIYNKISFGTTDMKIEEILKKLPREVCIYKDNKQSGDDK